MKKISVIIPAYNEEQYLAQALYALADQTFPRRQFEIIVVDNASTDSTRAVAYDCGADKVVVEKRRGTNQARQAGLEASEGDIVAFLDADCVPPTDWLEKIYRHLHTKKNACVAIAGSYIFTSKQTDSLYLAQEIYRWIVMPAVSTVFGRLLRRGGVLIGGNFAALRKHFKKSGGIDTSFTFFGDDASIARKFGEIGYVEFDPTLFVTTSARRFEREGLLKTNWEYTKNFFKVMLK